jgi:sulfoxide reductase heme-binding subunit YedZ
LSLNDRRNWQVFFGTVGLLLGLSAAWLSAVELSDDNIRAVIRNTARVAFVMYLVVLVARPLQQLLRRDWTAALLRNRRLVGVAFAATMSAHLGLIFYRFGSQPGLDPPPPNFIGYGAYTVFYLMLITSFDRPKRWLGARSWKVLHRTGLVLAAIVFAAPRSLADFEDPVYLAYLAALLLALAIRFTAWRQSRQPGTRRYAR